MSEFRSSNVALNVVDAVSPILRVIETLSSLGSGYKVSLPPNPVDVLTLPSGTSATLVPSEGLIALLAMVAHDARIAAGAAAESVALAKLTPSERQNRASAN